LRPRYLVGYPLGVALRAGSTGTVHSAVGVKVTEMREVPRSRRQLYDSIEQENLGRAPLKVASGFSWDFWGEGTLSEN
jgi:hypothetical protein